MRADIPAPARRQPRPGRDRLDGRRRIHITRRLLELLDGDLLRAQPRAARVRADGCWRVGTRLSRSGAVLLPGGSWVASRLVALGALLIPPAVVIGWTSRLSVLGMSRAREFAADAGAATLTDRPSALASALLKLDGSGVTPRADLRRVEPYAVLCIVGTDRSRLLSTRPPVAARVQRLEALERRIRRPS